MDISKDDSEAEQVLAEIETTFLEADNDRSGALDRKEFATVVHRLYQSANKQMRSRRGVQEEVDVVLALFDSDGDGILDFDEVVHMIASKENEAFKLQLDAGIKAAVLARVQGWQQVSIPHTTFRPKPQHVLVQRRQERLQDPDSAASRRLRWVNEHAACSTAASPSPAREASLMLKSHRRGMASAAAMTVSSPAGAPKLRAFFQELLDADEANQHCIDCGTGIDVKMADGWGQWASVNNGCYLCIQCTGRHRGLGVHHSFCRSLMQDGWKANQCRSMAAGGNRALTVFLQAQGIPASTPIEQKYTSGPSVAYRILLMAKAQEGEAVPSLDTALLAAWEALSSNCFDMGSALHRAHTLEELTSSAETIALAEAEVVKLSKAFAEADKDGSGGLDVGELTVLLQGYMADHGVSRSKKVLEKELAGAMAAGDTDRDGELQFYELARLLYGHGEEDERVLKLPGHLLLPEVRLAAARRAAAP